MLPNSIDFKLMADDVRRAYERRGFRTRTLPFVYTSPEAASVGNIIQTVTLETDRDSLFVWCGLSATLHDLDHDFNQSADAAVFAGLEIVGQAYRLTGKDLMPWTSFTGSGIRPHAFGFPIILIPGDRVVASWVNVEEAFNRAQFSLLGVKLFTTPYTREVVIPDHDEDLILPEKVSA